MALSFKPKISVCVPTHAMDHADYFLGRLKDSLDQQTFRDFELIITKEGKMAENTNAAIKKASGEIIKILYMDDFLFSRNALQRLVDNFKGGWYASACVHTYDGFLFEEPHMPSYNSDIRSGNNTIGSPSVIAFENNKPLLFDENLSWLLDCDLYARLYDRYGEPTLCTDLDIAIGKGFHQMTYKLTDMEKESEFTYLKHKYA